MVEYGLILALVAIAAFAGLAFLGEAVVALWDANVSALLVAL